MEHSYILHAGVKRKSGRYEWGSGEYPYQHEAWFQGWSKIPSKDQAEYAKSFGMTLKEARYRYSIGKDVKKAQDIGHAKELRYSKQMSVKAIAAKMGVSESTVNSWLKPMAEERARETEDLANKIAQYADKHAGVDIGKGCATAMGVNKTKFEAAIQLLKDRDGYYNVQWGQEQQTTGKNTQTTALIKIRPEWKGYSEEKLKKAAYKYVMEHADDITLPFEVKYNYDTGKTILGFDIPKSVSSKQIEVVYTDKEGKGGAERDGLIELRRGVPDLSLGNDNYSQVRIAVDDTHYIKGMAVYSDNLPDGINIRIHSNKKEGVPLKSDDPDAKQVLKPMKRAEDGSVDLEDPFGAQITAQRGCINKVNEEGKWGDWTSARSLASQVLSKQSPELAQKQLNLDYTKRAAEFDTIKQITNPVVREKMLIEFADECDKAAVHLKAAALPGQSVKVLIPIPSLKPGECYCPMYKDGEKLALIRFPHQSISEIPMVTVNNSNAEGKRVMTNQAIDAIGLNPKDAHRLSGADFDGDTVVCIPNKKGYIKNAPEFKGLEGYEPKELWPGYPGMKPISHQLAQTKMGIVTNLITDMSLMNAPEHEMVRAIKMAQLIIDAEKHKLNWRGAEEEYRIAELHEKYQGKKRGGAVTIVSKASGEYDVPERDDSYYNIDPKTGAKIPKYTGKKKVYFTREDGTKYYKNLLPYQEGYDPNAKDVMQKSTKMAETSDARTLVSPYKYPIETIYANYANQMKAMGNAARKESLVKKETPYSAQAAETYKDEVAHLRENLEKSKVNAALERLAQRSAKVIIDERIAKYPERYNKKTPDGKKHISKLKNQVTNQQRKIVSKQAPFDISEREWEAIQAGALHKSEVKEIINRANSDQVKKYAMPKNTNYSTLSAANLAHARAMINSGYTQADVAASFNISPSTLSKLLRGMS
jgi:transcriptional regulator with XRE-family HTH domain